MSLSDSFLQSVHDSKYCSVSYIRAKLRTRLSWATGMFILGTTDMLVNLLNCLDLTRADLARGLMMGPPTLALWVSLCVFTGVGTIIYIPETINTFSVFFNDGRCLVPIHLELLVTLPLESIPLAGINYFICRCRRNYTTGLQTMCGTFRIMFVFIRLVWHAHLQGKLLKPDSKKKMYKGFFMGCCALFACMMAFPVMSWRESPPLTLADDDIKNVSIYFLKAPFADNQKVYNQTITDLIELEGYTRQKSSLVPSLLPIKQAGVYGFNATYPCNENTTFMPVECRHGSQLHFKFIYVPNSPGGPYGEIRFNFAEVIEDPVRAAALNTSCVMTGRQVKDNWRLYYFYTTPVVLKGRRYIRVTSPWLGTCTTTFPWYDSTIQVC